MGILRCAGIAKVRTIPGLLQMLICSIIIPKMC